MKKTKATTTVRPIPADDIELESLCHELTATKINLEKLIAQRDEAQLRAAEPFAGSIASCQNAINEGLECLERWAVAHKARFAEGKSITVAGHRLGWRLGNWATKLASKATWSGVLDRLKDLIAIGEKSGSKIAAERAQWARDFIRTKEECNKEAMLANRTDELAGELLKDCGVLFKQDETFYLSPDREGQEGAELTR